MKKYSEIFVLGLALCAIPSAGYARQTNDAPALQWHDARDLTVEGKGWPDTKSFYDRWPARAEQIVRTNVWNLGHDSAGLCVRFVTDATGISVNWTLRKP